MQRRCVTTHRCSPHTFSSSTLAVAIADEPQGRVAPAPAAAAGSSSSGTSLNGSSTGVNAGAPCALKDSAVPAHVLARKTLSSVGQRRRSLHHANPRMRIQIIAAFLTGGVVCSAIAADGSAGERLFSSGDVGSCGANGFGIISADRTVCCPAK